MGSSPKLTRVLGFPALFAIAVGVVVAQGVFVSVLQGIGIGGASFFAAMIIAFILTLCYVFTFAELALMMPKAGGFSAYTEVSIGHYPAIVGTIAGYFTPAMFGLPAELFLLEYILDALYPGSFGYTSFVVIALLTIFNLMGVDFFAKVQSLLAYLMMAALLLVGIIGLFHSNPQGQSMTTLIVDLKQIDLSVFSLVILAIWGFLALEFVCPLIEETKNPKRNIPRSMIISAVVLLVIYSLISLSAYLVVPADNLTESDIPHFVFVNALFGDTGKIILTVLAITATCSTINTVIATLPRMLFGMANNNQVPDVFKKLHPRTNAPWVGIIFVAFIILIPTIILKGQQDIIITLMISAAAIWLLAYIISHINIIVLRNRYPDFDRPFKSPWYPLPQVLGIIGMIYIFINNSPTPEMTAQVYTNSGIIVLISSIYAVLWIKLKMKKNLFEPEKIETLLNE